MKTLLFLLLICNTAFAQFDSSWTARIKVNYQGHSALYKCNYGYAAGDVEYIEFNLISKSAAPSHFYMDRNPYVGDWTFNKALDKQFKLSVLNVVNGMAIPTHECDCDKYIYPPPRCCPQPDTIYLNRLFVLVGNVVKEDNTGLIYRKGDKWYNEKGQRVRPVLFMVSDGDDELHLWNNGNDKNN